MPVEIKRAAKTTTTLTGPTNQCVEVQPEGIGPRGTSCRNNRVPVVIILCPGPVVLARSCSHRKSEDLYHGTPSMPQWAE
ncbi:hypothetical protein AVEN_218363-1 [Araneus ventricosus]|uniref:Uncharacterized protein n=1 Tax=Araneus ventricosus TaxID=182803 RepID=A0A4Y2S225_ARAVE|nr:hypothetical protein AVEN_218363-1 [Araneus ventricosus]